MSQHDYDIANQSASAARSDINLALKALASTSSGATAPATTFANQLWYDTTADALKIRNEGNSAWITLGTIDQTNSKFEPNFTPATTGEAQAGTNNTKIMTALRVEEHMVANILGWGQTWQDVSGSRVAATSYQNTTGRPITVSVAVNDGNDGYLQASVDGTTWVNAAYFPNTVASSATMIIPATHYYRLSVAPGSFIHWSELR